MAKRVSLNKEWRQRYSLAHESGWCDWNSCPTHGSSGTILRARVANGFNKKTKLPAGLVEANAPAFGGQGELTNDFLPDPDLESQRGGYHDDYKRSAMTAGTCVPQAITNARMAMNESFTWLTFVRRTTTRTGATELYAEGPMSIDISADRFYDRPHKTIGKHKVVVSRSVFQGGVVVRATIRRRFGRHKTHRAIIRSMLMTWREVSAHCHRFLPVCPMR